MGRGLGKMQRLIIEELRRQKGGVWIERPWSYDINLLLKASTICAMSVICWRGGMAAFRISGFSL
jgi:hypothetical protein